MSIPAAEREAETLRLRELGLRVPDDGPVLEGIKPPLGESVTGSDGEYMTLLLAALPRTVIAGSNTYGVAQYIQPGYSVLPHTRLPFRIALGTSDIYGDNRSLDGHGLDVDILLSGEDEQSPESILSLAKHLGG